MDWFLLALKQYANFNGRSRRKEYWFFFLFYLLIFLGLSLLDQILGFGLLSSVFLLAMLLPSVAVGVRRLHDTGRTGWWILVGLIPLIGLVLIYFMLLDSDAGDNAYGPNPKAGGPGLA